MLEKSDSQKITFKTVDWHVMLRTLFTIYLTAFILGMGVAEAQVRAGNGFLKILPGVRNQGFGGSFTGVVDEMHVLYANPAATGFLREWQWSTSYTEWIADSYSLSWLYGQRVRTPISRHTRFALGVHYQGVREFNSTANPSAATASASDALFNFSVGTPLSFLSPNISLGGNLKYFRSDLDGVVDDSWISDVGVLVKTPRLSVNLFGVEYLLLSAGAAYTQLGSPLKFQGVETPLPKAFRSGVAVNMGRHDGFQMQLTGDYVKYRDEDSQVSIGMEFSWRYLLTVRAGYNFNDNLISKLAFGVSYRLGDLNGVLGKNSAMRMDFAYLEGNDLFSPPLRGGISHYPIQPESFRLLADTPEPLLPGDTLTLSWEGSNDPDLFDNTSYRIVLVKDNSAALEGVIAETQHSKILPPELEKNQFTDGTPLLQIEQPKTANTSYTSSHRLIINKTLTPGTYYWTVLAYDRDNHARFADEMGQFEIAEPPIPPKPPVKYDVSILSHIAKVAPLRPKALFKFNKADLTEFAEKILGTLGEALNSPDLSHTFVKLGGHTDQRGSAKYNKRLSERRANSVKNFLVEKWHISPERIFSYGYGKKYPLADAYAYPESEREAIHARNRRVEIYLLKEANYDTANHPIEDSKMVKAVRQGTPIRYETVLVNQGPDTASNVVLVADIPQYADMIRQSFSATHPVEKQSYSDTAAVWEFAAIAPGDTVHISYDLVVNRNFPGNPYNMVHTIIIQATGDSNVENNRASQGVFIIPLSIKENGNQ